jgi:nucleoid DNA-binding protein
MLKKELLDRLQLDNPNLTKAAIEHLLATYTEVITEELNGGSEFEIPRIGKFAIRTRNARNGRNPSTGEAIFIPESTVVAFKVSKVLKDALN